jgi:murein DD-endopeptidase MepM/ murein hydrolase activator NlpD
MVKLARPGPNNWLHSMAGLIISALVILALVIAYFIYIGYGTGATRTMRVHTWLRDPEAHPEWAVKAGSRCVNAPFLIPTSGFIGYLWRDSFRLGHHHQGIDIFGGTDVNVTPIYAAYSGYLTRMNDWKSSLIIRIPNDPLHPSRQIWTYYTHMAGPEGDSYIVQAFPPGSFEVYVKEGTLLGFQGNFSGTPGSPVGVHLHFSIVLDDGQGRFRNELEISNTLDPSPYLGMKLNADTNRDSIPVCGP